MVKSGGRALRIILLCSMMLQAHYFRMIFPYHGAVLKEGQSYTIRWQTDLRGMTCIRPVIGGHQTATLDDCHIPLQSGRWVWKVPPKFISGFGLNRADDVALEFENPQSGEDYYSSPTFTVRSSTHPSHYFRLLFPYPGAVLEEGRSYRIRWITDRKGPICIIALVGGHEREPNMQECRIPAESGSYEWYLFPGFVSGFGVKRSDDVRLAFTDARNGEDFYLSKPFSVVAVKDHHPKPYPIRFPPQERLIKSRDKEAHRLLSPWERFWPRHGNDPVLNDLWRLIDDLGARER
ncbi:hypothetical protein [Nitratifractor sp.]|uniref:hypothetical protein n=1 Tax=Nitratifractor sp. TaxID=2268144 RepID=UPI0025F4A50B|nr:hypothetical protein [Nitratifractor sp.]